MTRYLTPALPLLFDSAIYSETDPEVVHGLARYPS